jgi:uncharacterized protein (TIGR03085 family)
MTTIARHERAALTALLTEVGPDAPTLCEGWDAHDLAAHLVARERRPDASAGQVVRPLAGHTAQVERGYRRRPFADLVQLLGRGAPPWSVFFLPPVDRLLNAAEYFVHHEDVRRARPGWQPRPLPDRVQDGLWRLARGSAKVQLRGAGCGVVLRRPDGESVQAVDGEPTAVVTGEPAELLMYVFGRRDHARVEVTGPAGARACLAGTDLEV